MQGALPLKTATQKKIALFGPFANPPDALMLGNYYNVPNAGVTTPLEALQAAKPAAVTVSWDANTAAVYSGANVAADVTRCNVSWGRGQSFRRMQLHHFAAAPPKRMLAIVLCSLCAGRGRVHPLLGQQNAKICVGLRPGCSGEWGRS